MDTHTYTHTHRTTTVTFAAHACRGLIMMTFPLPYTVELLEGAGGYYGRSKLSNVFNGPDFRYIYVYIYSY